MSEQELNYKHKEFIRTEFRKLKLLDRRIIRKVNKILETRDVTKHKPKKRTITTGPIYIPRKQSS